MTTTLENSPIYLNEVNGDLEGLPSGDFIQCEDVQALREFFQAEQDERLGRWRHPDYPDIYVRPMNGNPDILGIVKDDEAGLAYDHRTRDMGVSLDPMTIVAHAYFQAHPEPKPEWHDASPGEVWVVTSDLFTDAPAFVNDYVEEGRSFFTSDETVQGITDKAITSAHRIYPPAD